jgi:hypothetical protein
MRADRTEHEGVGGKPDGAAIGEIPLINGGVALVDATDLAALNEWRWSGRDGYAWTRIKLKSGRREVAMHRFIAGARLGQTVDHINGTGLDNRRANLRVCNTQENTRNRKRHSNNSSGYKGVILDGGRFRAVIMVDGKQVALGGFSSAIRAALAYDRAAAQYFGEFARPNFSPMRDWILPEPVKTNHSEKISRTRSRDRGSR